MAIDDNTSYELTGYQVKDLAQKVRAKADSSSLASVATSGLYSDLTGRPTIPTVYNGELTITQGGTTLGTFTANSSTNATIDIPTGGSTYTAGNGIDITNDEISVDTTVVATQTDLADKSEKFVIMMYGESNAWAKFLAAYNSNAIVYCRASSASNPGSGNQNRLAFMAYVNNETSPTEVEFQYVRSVNGKTASQPVDQVFVYKLTSASGGTWSVTTRDMAPKIAAGTGATVSYSNGTYTIGATVPSVVQTTGQSTTDVMSQKAVTDIIGDIETVLQTLNTGTGV